MTNLTDMVIELHNCGYTMFEIVAATKIRLDDVIRILAEYREKSGYYDHRPINKHMQN